MKLINNMKKKIFVIIIILILFGATTYFVYNHLEKDDTLYKEAEVIDTIKIDNYNYTLEDRDTKLYKNLYKSLKEVLDKDNIDFKDYAEVLSKLYITDLYTINNKITKYDVGSLEFVFPEVIDNYKLNVMDTLYKYIESDAYDDRIQILPEVSEVNISSIEDNKFEYNNKSYDGYKVSIDWKYKEDLGYETDATLYLIKIDDILYVASETHE